MLDVYQVNNDFLHLEQENLEFLFKNRAAVIRLLDDPDQSINLVNVFIANSLEFTYNNNQFIHLDDDEHQRLFRIYLVYIQGMRTLLAENSDFESFQNNFSILVKDHFKDLSGNISRFFDRETGWQIQENIILKQVVCGEYSPQFQMNLLGLDDKTLVEPVLDIGCGKTGTLVKHLRTLGFKAIGVDRLVESDPSLKSADWFDLDLIPETWGTIISHIAFSNHFLFHHRYKKGKPDTYARLYMRILQSLKSGGKFIYSPGLPFIEQYLPVDRFIVTSRKYPGLPDQDCEILPYPEVVTVSRVSPN